MRPALNEDEERRDSLGRQVRILALTICQQPPCAVGNHSLCGWRHPEL